MQELIVFKHYVKYHIFVQLKHMRSSLLTLLHKDKCIPEETNQLLNIDSPKQLKPSVQFISKYINFIYSTRN